MIYLFCDAVYESLRQQADAGRRSGHLGDLLGRIEAIAHEPGEQGECRKLAGALPLARNLPTPITVTTDGTPGLIKAVEAMWPEAERIRCWFHKMKNVLEKVPEDQHELIKRLLQDVRDAPDHASGVKRVEELIENHQGELPSAMACLRRIWRQRWLT